MQNTTPQGEIETPSKLRVAWDAAKDYPVIVHRDWSAKRTRSRSATERRRSLTLKHHPLYWDAKSRGDYIAAQEIVDDLICDEALLRLSAIIGENRTPLIVAPSLTKEDPTNVIPVSFAHSLAFEFDFQVCRDIYQHDKAHRTGRSGFYRLAMSPEFYGHVIEGQDYVIVDDVATLGGTLAGLRSFIEDNGGNVIAMSVLADSNMKARTGQGGLEKDFNLNASVDAIKNLERKHGKRLDAFFRRNNGFGLESLTAREVDFLAFFGRENGIERSILEEKQAAYIADNARKQP
tara:strand:- start:144976 stop:145848 length:873 start_codon:yes stop_codon:yes gene_type:complete